MNDILEYTPNKTQSIHHLGNYEIDQLKQKVANLPAEYWDTKEDFKSNYNKTKALKNVQHVIFKFADKREPPYKYFNLEKWESWKELLLPIMNNVVRSYGYQDGFYPRVMLAKLAPGGMISPHVDGIPPKVGGHKIHLVLNTNEDCYFYLVPDRHHLKVNNAYEINNARMHSVLNNGSSDRIHLIFEYLDINIQPNRDYLLSL